jgi:hypothetical protein
VFSSSEFSIRPSLKSWNRFLIFKVASGIWSRFLENLTPMGARTSMRETGLGPRREKGSRVGVKNRGADSILPWKWEFSPPILREFL